MRIQVKDFMTAPVITATEKSTIAKIRNLMERNNIHAIPIIEYLKKLPEADISIKGIITSSDLAKATNDLAPADKYMTHSIHIIHKDSSAQAAAKMMLKHHVHHLVVMDEGMIAGMISSLDFVRLVSEHTLD